MKKIFKSLYLVLFATLVFAPILKADNNIIEDVYVYLEYDAAPYVAGKAPEFFAKIEGTDGNDIPLSSKYEVSLETVCEKDTEVCFTSNETINEELEKAGNLLTKYVAGKTYSYSVVLIAKEGYTFSEDVYLSSYYDDSEAELTVNSSVVTIKDYLVDKALIPIEKAEVTGATVMFRVGDKPVFTAKSNSDLYTISYEEWNGYDSETDYYKSVTSDADYNKSIEESGDLLEKFDNYKYTYYLVLEPASGYVFTNDSEVTFNGTKALGAVNYGSYSISRILDLTDRSAEEKNKDAINYALFETIVAYQINGEGFSEELYEELMQAETNGSDVTIELTTAVLTNDTAKKEIDNATAALLKNAKVASYLDLSIPVTIDGTVKGYITELYNPVNLTIEIPSDLPKVANNQIRVYNVIRIHDGKATSIDAFDNGDGTVTFATDKFSSYALTYTDVINPETGDNIVLYVLASVMSLSLMLASIYVIKNN